jgi:large subunit ribosomal protein L21
LRVEKIDKKVKSIFTVPDVLAVLNEDSDIDLGTPRAKTKVTAEVLEHGKGDKIYVIKYKPKIRYRRKTGHRQRFTCIKIISIG